LNAPCSLYIVPVQAEKATAAAQAIFWGLSASGGLSWEKFQDQAAVPWNETRFWGLVKETPTVLSILFSKC
jgi:hypothetical protein